MSHTKDDKIVGWDEMKVAQKELNGHASMLIKIFRIGQNWGHEARVRETMMGKSLEACPVHLLYKDHKGWSQDKGGVPPTRSAAGGNRGMNLHISEVLSVILELLVGRVEGGTEAELEIVVELGNLVPRKNLVSQKVSLVLRYLQS